MRHYFYARNQLKGVQLPADLAFQKLEYGVRIFLFASYAHFAKLDGKSLRGVHSMTLARSLYWAGFVASLTYLTILVIAH